MHVNAGQEFVIGGYTPSLKNFDALVIRYYDGPQLMYAARTATALRQHRALSWTEDFHLRHSRFVALRDDKKAKDVRREN